MHRLDYESQLRYVAARPRPSGSLLSIDGGSVVGVMILLTLLSLVLVVKGAGDEPFLRYQQLDALLHVGGSAILISGWLTWSGAVALLVMRQRVHQMWLFALGWMLICLFYLHWNLNGYLWDIENLVLRPPPYLRGT